MKAGARETIAERIEPLDSAMATIFTPLTAIGREEYRRTTEVTQAWANTNGRPVALLGAAARAAGIRRRAR